MSEGIQNKICETADMLREEESYYRKAWNNLFIKYQSVKDPYEYTLDEIEGSLTQDPEINRPIRKASASSVSLSGEESFPNPNISLLDGRTQRTTRSLTSSDEDSCLKSPLKHLELNVDKLSPERVKHVTHLSPMSPNTITTTQQTDVLYLDTTSPIRLSRIPFTPLYSPPKRVTKLAMLKSNEVLPEVELMISKFFKEFVNTDVLPVLRGILTFKTFRYKAETQNQMISPYIEKSLSMPLRYKNMEYNLRVTPITKRVRSCSTNQTMPGRRAIGMTRWTNNSSFQSNSKLISDISYENSPIKLLETSQTKQNPDTPAKIQFTNLSRNKVRTPSIIRFNSSLETSNTFVPSNSYENCPIKLLETSQTREDTPIRDTPVRTQQDSNNILINKPLLNHSFSVCPIRLLETSQTREDTSIRDTPVRTQQDSNNILINKPLLNHSFSVCPIRLLETSQTREDTSISDTPSRTQLTTIPQTIIVRRPNNIPVKLLDTSSERDILCHNVNLTTPLPLASPNCSIRLLDTSTPDILASNSRSVCQALDFRPSGYRPLCNSTPSKRTFSKLNEVNLSKRVRLDCDANANCLD